ncbi:hypothetical protein [Mesobacillus subterraneus]|uniref:Uncharacterized protein n=1 Tax=Mesobacillus subterraneus TaxID=285983 RepID=A0A3R9E898_9BACI|nr:hypothetical protein [Mesobacillus subterraneus]RSD26216.1 hypothetical protein EJA10_15485 [Mesobacillus subterraneus]
MNKKRNWKWMILPATLFLMAFGVYAGYSLWESGNGGNIRSLTASEGGRAETVAVFQENTDKGNYKNVGDFISKFHTKYNDTLGWGGIDSVEWEEQREIASEIRSVLAAVETDNVELQSDFEVISNYLTSVENGRKDKKALLMLHRYFHDLDVEFNGYRGTKDYFNVTKYKYSEND